jgi:iron complex transport system substrate-binding protein
MTQEGGASPSPTKAEPQDPNVGKPLNRQEAGVWGRPQVWGRCETNLRRVCYSFWPMAGVRRTRKVRGAAWRIVSLAPNATSILCEIGAGKMLVGVSKWCADVAPVEGLPTFGDLWKLDEVAGIHALKPDVVIGSVPFRAEAIAKLLERPLNLLALHPQTLLQIERDVRQLGALVGRTEAAEGLIVKMNDRWMAARKRAKGKQRLRVYAEAWPNPRISSPPWVEELCTLAGAKFVPKTGQRVSEEELAEAQPDVMLLAWAATGSKAKLQSAYDVGAWKNVPAIRNRHVFVVRDELLNTPGPPLLEGVRELERIFGQVRKDLGRR